MDWLSFFKVGGAVIGSIFALAFVIADDISFSPVVSLTTVIVTFLVTGSLAWTQYKSKASAIYKEEAEAERKRVLRLYEENKQLQVDKDAIGLQLKNAEVTIARLEGLPDMTTIQRMIEGLTDVMRVQAHSGHELGQQMLERLNDHHQKMMQLHSQFIGIMEDLRKRQMQHRKEDDEYE